MGSLARLDVDGAVATLTMDRPESRNALSIGLLSSMHECLDMLSAHDGESRPRVLVVAGEGKSFCAGMDLKAVLGDPEAPPKLLGSLAEFAVRLREAPQVVVARVQGAAIGGGCGLACACDFVVTHQDAKLGFPEVDLGACPAVVAPWLVRKIGAGRARHVLLGGLRFDGLRAREWGLADELARDAGALGEVCGAFVERLATGGPLALAATKALLNELDGSLDRALAERGAEISAGVLATDEARRMLERVFEGKG